MRNDVEVTNPDDIKWSQSRTAPSGCWGKPIYRYDEDRLGNIGRAGPYTTLYRFEPGSFYRPIIVRDQAIEIFVISGVLAIDDVEVGEGSWARILPTVNPIVLGSILGSEIVAIVRGRVELGENDANFGEQK